MNSLFARISALIGFVCLACWLNAQEPVVVDSLANALPQEAAVQDTKPPEKKKKRFRFFGHRKNPNPKKALILGLVIPGAGQIYNQRYWKLPLVYGAYAGMIYLVDYNTDQYRFVRDEYIKRVDNDPETVDIFAEFSWTEQEIRALRDSYNKNKELSYIGLFAVHILASLEGYIDAHLIDFQVTEDLSLRLSPSMQQMSTQGVALGLGVSLNLQKRSPRQPKPFYTTP